MYNDVREFVAQCETCYQVKVNAHAKKAKVQFRKIPKTVSHDTFGPFKIGCT